MGQKEEMEGAGRGMGGEGKASEVERYDIVQVKKNMKCNLDLHE